jgi:hypothetical protein
MPPAPSSTGGAVPKEMPPQEDLAPIGSVRSHPGIRFGWTVTRTHGEDSRSGGLTDETRG